MCQLVYDDVLGLAHQNCVEVHLFERRAAVGNLAQGNHFQVAAEEANQLRNQGHDVVLGLMEPHRPKETADLNALSMAASGEHA